MHKFVTRWQTSADSTVRVLSLSRFCPDFPENRVRSLSAIWILSGFSVRCLSVRILSVSILSIRCPCPPTSDLKFYLPSYRKNFFLEVSKYTAWRYGNPWFPDYMYNIYSTGIGNKCLRLLSLLLVQVASLFPTDLDLKGKTRYFLFRSTT